VGLIVKYRTFGILLLAICIVSGVGYLAANALTSTLHVYIQLLPENIGPGDTLTISVNVTDIIGTPIDGAEVTATIGDLEIIYILTQHGNGHYRVTIDTPVMMPGTYDVTVTVQKEEYRLVRTSMQLVISVVD
jgi:uncharacterized protein YfaS (alpha-2-macroglobulin family)